MAVAPAYPYGGDAAAPPILLTAGGHEVGAYGWDTAPPARAVPRPAVHPLRTPRGTLLTDEYPEDHPWHRGLGLALPDVNGTNLWGGPTYVRGAGYQDRELGTVHEAAPARQQGDTVTHELTWCDASGLELLRESRRIRVGAGPGGSWWLEWSSVLFAGGGRAVSLGSPASNGRAGAGYGGFFWRLPPLRPDRTTVSTPAASGEHHVNGTRADWLAVTAHDGEASWTAVLTTPRADPWFTRLTAYPGLGSSLAPDHPLHLPPHTPLPLTLRLTVTDGPHTPSHLSAR